jgi:hypothetical protein
LNNMRCAPLGLLNRLDSRDHGSLPLHTRPAACTEVLFVTNW